MKKTLTFKQFKKIALVDMRPDLYLILRFLCVPLEEDHVPLVVRVPHFENHWSRCKEILRGGLGGEREREQLQARRQECVRPKSLSRFNLKQHHAV